jgi:hypothetical protein
VDFEPVKNDPSDPSVLGSRNMVLVLTLLAAAHVIVFSAALPFFNNMDEAWHLDLVSRYAQGDVPRKQEPLAFMPQSVFYAISNDGLCPVVFGWVFILLLQWREQSLTPRLAIFLGLARASVFLTKHSSLPLPAVAGG